MQWKTFLPTAYVVRREGNVLTRVCPTFCLSTPRGAVPRPGPGGRGVPQPGPAGWGGVPLPGGILHLGSPRSDLAREGTLMGGTSPRIPPVRPGGYPDGRVPHLGYPPVGPGPGGYPGRMEYLIHRGLYASYVHAGGLSCGTSLYFHFKVRHWGNDGAL